ncbi:MAG: hypothetical protein ACYDAJ_07480 [Nitrosotalea sp.]
MKPFWKRSEQTEPVRDIASELSLCCQTLDKESISIIIESFAENGNFILSGDASCNLNLPYDLRYKFNSIEADSMLNDEKLEEFQETLVSKLLEKSKLVTSKISDGRYYVMNMKELQPHVTMINKDVQLQPCVTMVPKEFTLI